MFWPILLPLQITIWSLAGLVVIVTAVAPRFRWKRSWTFVVSTFFAGLLFIPSCTGVMVVVDSLRFGRFEHASFADVNDERVERYLPPAATSIKIEKYSSGFRARYSITDAELSDHLDEVWDRYGDRSFARRDEANEARPVDPESIGGRFRDLGWPPLIDAREYQSPRASNGAGSTIWFSPTEGVAYQQAGYW